MLKKTKFALLIIFSILLISNPFNFAKAENNQVNIYFFWADGCPHCAKEKPFLEKMEKKYDYVTLYDFEVVKNKENAELFIEVGKKLNAETSGVPFTVIGNKYFIGWYNEKTSGETVEKIIQQTHQQDVPDLVSPLIPKISEQTEESEPSQIRPAAPFEEKQSTSPLDSEDIKEIPKTVNLPLIGEIETENISLPILTIIIAALDGFNPCAMWVLLFLISLLLGMENKKRMWTLGTAFIVSSALVYFVFLSAWLNLFLFVGFILWVRIIIGSVAIFSGACNIKSYVMNKKGCKIIEKEKRKKIFDKLREITQKKQFWLALIGIVLLAFAVNLVELVCSAGLPAVFTGILTLTEMPTWQYYLYLLLYIFIFMLDDLIIFIIAMSTLHAVGVSSKYSRISKLVGGIIIIIIGLILLFKPDLLMFG